MNYWKSTFLDVINNFKLHGIYLTIKAMVGLSFKLYKIYKASKSITKQQFSNKNSCYHNNINGVKYFNVRKASWIIYGKCLPRYHEIQWPLITETCCYMCINFF